MSLARNNFENSQEGTAARIQEYLMNQRYVIIDPIKDKIIDEPTPRTPFRIGYTKKKAESRFWGFQKIPAQIACIGKFWVYKMSDEFFVQTDCYGGETEFNVLADIIKELSNHFKHIDFREIKISNTPVTIFTQR